MIPCVLFFLPFLFPKGPKEIQLHGIQDTVSKDKTGRFTLQCTIGMRIIDCFPQDKTIVVGIGDVGKFKQIYSADKWWV